MMSDDHLAEIVRIANAWRILRLAGLVCAAACVVFSAALFVISLAIALN